MHDPTPGASAPPSPAAVAPRPRLPLRHLAGWVAYFGAFGLLAVAPVFPPLGGDDFVLPPGILDDPDMLLWAVAGTWFAFAIAAVLAWGARLTPRDLGLAPLAWGPFLGWTAVLLSALFASATLAELLFGESLRVVEPLTRRPSGLAHWLLWLGLAASAGFCEEFFMRGYGMGLLARAGAPGWVGLTLTSAIFGLLHLYEGPHAVAIIGLWGLLFGVSFQRTGSLLPAMTAHFAVDAVAPLFLRG